MATRVDYSDAAGVIMWWGKQMDGHSGDTPPEQMDIYGKPGKTKLSDSTDSTTRSDHKPHTVTEPSASTESIHWFEFKMWHPRGFNRLKRMSISHHAPIDDCLDPYAAGRVPRVMTHS